MLSYIWNDWKKTDKAVNGRLLRMTLFRYSCYNSYCRQCVWGKNCDWCDFRTTLSLTCDRLPPAGPTVGRETDCLSLCRTRELEILHWLNRTGDTRYSNETVGMEPLYGLQHPTIFDDICHAIWATLAQLGVRVAGISLNWSALGHFIAAISSRCISSRRHKRRQTQCWSNSLGAKKWRET